jgi:ketosteroid isomerase-like protein
MAPDVVGYGSVYDANGLAEFKARAAAPLSTVRAARLVGRQDVTMSGNLAFVAFMTDVDREGSAQAVRQRWTLVLQKRDARWVIAHYHLSPDPSKN